MCPTLLHVRESCTPPCRFGSALVFEAPGELNLKKKSFKFDFSPLDPGAQHGKIVDMVKNASFQTALVPPAPEGTPGAILNNTKK